ncbi:hypothetical protein [Kitasatospora sp. NPDC051914]|uniref:hypothetical protein n=1 Tax=Kitasatospora sp. NPDC051914 TaxID=3154945 RepID=UPI00341DD192
MTQTARSTAPATGLIPGQRPPAEPPVVPAAAEPETGLGAALRRGFAVARGLRSLRPVPARTQEPYGEVDGQ